MTKNVVAGSFPFGGSPRASYDSTDKNGSGPPATLRAFPGAEGVAALTRGAAGYSGSKTIAYVDNLNDSGAGSFRAAVEGTGKEGTFVVFRVSGTINLLSTLECRSSYITIAGQTSPGGICLAGLPLVLRNKTGPEEPIHDIIITHLRMRGGEHEITVGNITNAESFRIWGATDVMVHQCSFTWSVDETIDVTSYQSTGRNCDNITFSHCIIAAGLTEATLAITGSENNHGYGIIMSGGWIDWGANKFDFHNCLFAHCNNRMPLLQNRGRYNLVNNVVHDFTGMQNTFIQFATGVPNKLYVNLYGHYAQRGANGNAPGPGGAFASGEAFASYGSTSTPLPDDANAYEAVWMEDCFGLVRTLDADNQWCLINSTTGQLAPTSWQSLTEFDFSDRGVAITKTDMNQTNAKTNADAVATNAGALRPFKDAIDTQYSNDFINNTGNFVTRANPPIWASGTADNNHSTVLTYSSLSLTTNELVGETIYNTTDNCSGVVTANTATTITVSSLTGGTNNSWTAGDSFIVSRSGYNFSLPDYPDLRTGAPAYYTDTDADGIPDAYETYKSVSIGSLNPFDTAPSGYYWIEDYINDLSSGAFS